MQERNGYLFCLEDRASLCTNCDVSTHMGSLHASSHQRFLNSGIQVALHSPIDNNNNNNTGFNSRNSSLPMPETYFNFLADNEIRTAMTMEVEAGSTETRWPFGSKLFLRLRFWSCVFLYFFFFFFFSRLTLSTVNSAFMHCLRSHILHFSATFLLKMGPTALFTHLKIISLQYF